MTRDEVLVKVDMAHLLTQIGFADVDPMASKYQGYCIFHSDVNTKSFSCSFDKKIFFCYGCNLKGDAIALYMKWRNIERDAAMAELATLPDIRSVDRLDSQLVPVAVVPTYKRLAMYTEFVHSLPMVTATPYKVYMNSRGFSDYVLDKFGVRGVVMTAAQDNPLVDFYKRYSVDELVAVGLVDQKDKSYARLRFTSHPIILPYYLGSLVVYLQGRLMGDGDGKITRYMNVRGSITHAYNHDALLRSVDDLFICEGVTDVLSMVELGYENVIGVPGANNFHPDWLIDFKGKRIVLALDNDKAGAAAAGRIGNYARSRGLIVDSFTLPVGIKDINKLLMAQRGLLK